MNSGLRITTCVLLLLAVAPRAGATGANAILIYGPESATLETQVKARNLLGSTVAPEDMPASTIHILDLPFPSPDPVWIAGDARVVPCTDPAAEETDLAALLAEAVDHIDALDYEAGKRVLDRAITVLPCASQPVDRTVLIDLFYFRGIAAFHMGDRDGARQSFRHALAIDRHKTWDTNYPPEPQQVFLLAKEDTVELDRVDIGHDIRDADISSFTFDGVQYPADSPGLLQVLPGMHLVQYRAGDAAYSRLVEVRVDGATALVTRRGLTAAVMSGPSSQGVLPAARASLRALVQGRNLDRAYVVILGDDDHGRLYQYDESYTTVAADVVYTPPAASSDGAATDEGSAGEDAAVEGDGTADAPRADVSPDAVVAREGGAYDTRGGITLGVAGICRAHDATYACFSLRGQVRLVRGLELDIGVGLNLTRYEDAARDLTVVMPTLRPGLRYRFGAARFRPYVGLAFLGTIWEEKQRTGVDSFEVHTRFGPGGALFGGFDVHLARPVCINLDADLGFSHALWLGVRAGLALRF